MTLLLALQIALLLVTAFTIFLMAVVIWELGRRAFRALRRRGP
jgi:hypothetical protein